MRIYFEEHRYERDLIEPYLSIPSENESQDVPQTIIPIKEDREGFYVEHIGYIFVSNDKYSGPVFILPKVFLMKVRGEDTVLGMQGFTPKSVIDTEADNNPLAANGYDFFLPELSLWLFRSITRYREESVKEDSKENKDNIVYITPDEGSYDRDFLCTAVRLMDFLSDHRNLFTQISIINHSGNARTDWHKTVKTIPFVKNGKPFYLDRHIKDKTINIDEELIVLYYSVLKFLREKYHFPISIGDVPYDLKKTSEIQRYLDTGLGEKRMRDIRGKYFRDDLKCLWSLLDSFFTFNTSKDNKKPIREALVVKDFNLVFENMIDHLIGDTNELAALKTQKDGKLIDHIYIDRSLIGPDTNIYFIGDSKYYSKENNPQGVSLYKQYTYARNALQHNINDLYLKRKENPNTLRYRDSYTEGYNVTPNFFIRCHVIKSDMTYNNPDLKETEHQPHTNIHFHNRLFDRDTLIVRQFTINLLYVLASYASYEDCTKSLRKTIRESLIDYLNSHYKFFKIVPEYISVKSDKDEPLEIPFYNYHSDKIIGKAYRTSDDSDEMILAFERHTPKGQADYTKVSEAIRPHITGGSIDTEAPLEKN